MIANSNLSEPTTTERPRAFEPSQAHALPTPARAPGWDLGPERRIDDGRTLARMLGWASIGLGAVELLAADRLAGFLGVDEEHTSLIRLYGAREIAQGAVILASRDPEPGIWARIAGDALDLGTLGAALTDDNPRAGAVFGALAMVAGITALDVMCAAQLRARPN